MPAYCVAANCNYSQTTPGITMHELLRNRPAVRWKWIKFIQFKRADFLAVPHHVHLCREHFSECNYANPWNTAWGLLRSWHDVPVLFQNPAWQAQTDTAVSLWVSWAKYQFLLRSSSWPFCSDSPEWHSKHMVTWFGRHGDAFGTTENAFFSCIYNPQITVSPTSSFSASFNGNRVKNHPLDTNMVLLRIIYVFRAVIQRAITDVCFYMAGLLSNLSIFFFSKFCICYFLWFWLLHYQRF